MLQLMKTGR